MAEPLNIQDYLDASSHASKRARTVIVTLVIASVLVFAGLLNSIQNNWMSQRLEALSDIKHPYTQRKVGMPPDARLYPKGDQDPEYKRDLELYRQKYLAFYSYFVKQHVENTYGIRVPFFAITLDVNDLGLLGGFAFSIILVLLRFSLSRELDNLRLSFSEAKKLAQLPEFYHLLAMSQVFTVPKTEYIRRGKLLIYSPKFLCLLPFIMHLAVIGHDLWTFGIGSILSQIHVFIVLFSEIILLIIILILTGMCIGRLIQLDKVWDAQWKEIKNKKNKKAGNGSGEATSTETPSPNRDGEASTGSSSDSEEAKESGLADLAPSDADRAAKASPSL